MVWFLQATCQPDDIESRIASNEGKFHLVLSGKVTMTLRCDRQLFGSFVYHNSKRVTEIGAELKKLLYTLSQRHFFLECSSMHVYMSAVRGGKSVVGL